MDISINYTQFRQDLLKNPNSLRNLALGNVKRKVEAFKKDLIEEFKDNEYSAEIAGGENATNISQSLGGKGNLFSFIGFTQGETPVDDVVKDLENSINVEDPRSSPQVSSTEINFEFIAKVPTMSELDAAHPMPSWSNKGWLSAVRNGIAGFQSYMYWKVWEQSRSSTGLQAKKGGNPDAAPQKLRDGKFEPAKYYLSDMLKAFKEKLRG